MTVVLVAFSLFTFWGLVRDRSMERWQKRLYCLSGPMIFIADVDLLKGLITEHGIEVEDFGGCYKDTSSDSC